MNVTRWPDQLRATLEDDARVEAIFGEREQEQERTLEERIAAEEAALCCQDPANFTYHEGGLIDPDTGYADEPYYQCSCGSRMGAADYAQICAENALADRKPVLPELPACFKFIEVA